MKLLDYSYAPSRDEMLQHLHVQIRLKRVFVLRIWLGVRLMKLAVWVIGGRAEVAVED